MFAGELDISAFLETLGIVMGNCHFYREPNVFIALLTNNNGFRTGILVQ